jgi:hypothetical protein
LLNPNRASLQAGREPTTLTTLNLCKKLQKFDYVAEKGSDVRNYALKVSCSLAKNYLAVETQRADK